MEELINLIRNLQSKFEEQTNEIRDMKQSIPQTINSNIDTKFANLELKYNTLQKSVDMQSQRIQQLERKIRKKNLIFFGVEESERNYFDLQQGILDILEQKMGLNCNETNIEEATSPNKPPIRPVTAGTNDHNPPLNPLYICTYNARSLLSDERLLEFKDAIWKIHYDVIGLAEIRRTR
ncbi:Endonuclease-reverse transcriptase [Operophtera brumata]|uniref:Endonuclease-reverse transcriptase n=1 Tax=Operophtera brumata TaxID=104452 RepID=A0A0L7KNI1_OPEBR|nr:Endonuclease-reverse transcriptase [Operophtera brumata]